MEDQVGDQELPKDLQNGGIPDLQNQNPQGQGGNQHTPPPNDLPVTLPEGFIATKTIACQNKPELKLLARHFGLNDQGLVRDLKARVKAYLYTNADHFVPIRIFRPLFPDGIQREHLPPEDERSPSPPPRTPSVAPSRESARPRGQQGFPDVPRDNANPPQRGDDPPGRRRGRRRSASPSREREHRQSIPRAPSPRMQRQPAFAAGDNNNIFGEVPPGEHLACDHDAFPIFYFLPTSIRRFIHTPTYVL